MQGKLIGYSNNKKQFTDKNGKNVDYVEMWLTFALPYEESRGVGYYSKSVKTTKNQLSKCYDLEKLKVNKVYELHYDENKKISLFKEVKE